MRPQGGRSATWPPWRGGGRCEYRRGRSKRARRLAAEGANEPRARPREEHAAEKQARMARLARVVRV